MYKSDREKEKKRKSVVWNVFVWVDNAGFINGIGIGIDLLQMKIYFYY